jgi:uroporphyrinogen-III synthase
LRIALTRPEGRNERLARSLRTLGHDVVEVPLIAVEPLAHDPIDVTPYDWVVVTSATGARELRRRMRGSPRHVAAIGRATADAFGEVDLVPKVSTQEGLVAEFPGARGKVLFAGAEDARRLLVEQLGADFVPLYRTRLLTPREPLDVDLVVLASPSAANALAGARNDLPVVSIGPETTAAARDLGMRVVREAQTQDHGGLLDAVIAATR